MEIFPVTIAHVTPEPFFTSLYERAGWHRRGGVHRVAVWYWELAWIPENWARIATEVDEVWCASPFVADAFRDRLSVPVHEVLPSVELEPAAPYSRHELGVPPENYVFLFTFDLASIMERKNPLALIRAFRAAFARERDVNLVLKITRSAQFPTEAASLRAAMAGDDRIVLIDQLLPPERVQGLIQECDCYASLHRSEGFGLGLAEAMLRGKPVIGTAYSGNLAFMHEKNSLLVDYTLVPVTPGLPVYREGRWAEPSHDHAVAQLRFCYEQRERAAALGASARMELTVKLSRTRAGERMLDRLAKSGIT